MSGGLMQLVAYGAQDVYLTGSPQITFFKIVYRRHTNFSIEPIPITFQSQPGYGKRSTVLVSRNGDLVTQMYLRVVLNEYILYILATLMKKFLYHICVILDILNYLHL